MVATRGRTFKRPWRRSCLSSKLKSSSAPIGRKDSWCFHAVGSSNAPLLGSTAAEGLPRIGRTSIATRWRSCGLPQSASCSENFVIPPDVFGQTLSLSSNLVCHALHNRKKILRSVRQLMHDEFDVLLVTSAHRDFRAQCQARYANADYKGEQKEKGLVEAAVNERSCIRYRAPHRKA